MGQVVSQGVRLLAASLMSSRKNGAVAPKLIMQLIPQHAGEWLVAGYRPAPPASVHASALRSTTPADLGVSRPDHPGPFVPELGWSSSLRSKDLDSLKGLSASWAMAS